MVWLIDLVAILMVALFTFIGYKKGLIKVAVNILAFFIAIIISLILYKPISNIVIEKTQIDENIQTTIVSKILPEGAKADDEAEVNQNFKGLIENNAKNTFNNMAKSIAVKIIQIGALLIIYIVARIILKFVSLLTSIIEKIPIIKQFNKAGGTIYGFIKGMFLVWIILAVIYLVNPLIPTNFINEINNSLLVGLLYKNNLLLNIIV